MEQAKEYYQKWTEIPQPRKIKAMRLIAFACYFLFLLLLIIYAFGRTGKKSVPITPTILFTDGTPYNLEVIRYLAQRRDVVLSMVIVSTNALAAAQLKANTAAATELITTLQSEGLKTYVPSVYGSYNSTTNSFLDALDTKMASSTVNFLIVGPCTDAAYFLQNHASRRSNVNKIFVAGGAFNTVGNANYLNPSITVAERNFYMDPSAANYIVSAEHGCSVVVVPMDAALTWTTAAYNALVTSPSPSTESAVEVASGLKWYYDNVDKTNRITVGIAAAAYAVDTQVQAGVTVTIIPVSVHTSMSSARYGGSYRPPASAAGKNVTVVLSLVANTFFSHLVNVNSLALV